MVLGHMLQAAAAAAAEEEEEEVHMAPLKNFLPPAAVVVPVANSDAQGKG